MEKPLNNFEASEYRFAAEISSESLSDPGYIFHPLPATVLKILSNYTAVHGYVVEDKGDELFVLVLKHNYIMGQTAWAIYGGQYEENYVKLKLKRFIVLNMKEKKAEIVYIDNSI